uniref:Very-long-chain 3-oxoacyl-CoA synthase n=1 Tax=Steinernema glaseri TaxID=37863 RepID=A0A1I7YWU2_9BILA
MLTFHVITGIPVPAWFKYKTVRKQGYVIWSLFYMFYFNIKTMVSKAANKMCVVHSPGQLTPLTSTSMNKSLHNPDDGANRSTWMSQCDVDKVVSGESFFVQNAPSA